MTDVENVIRYAESKKTKTKEKQVVTNSVLSRIMPRADFSRDSPQRELGQPPIRFPQRQSWPVRATTLFVHGHTTSGSSIATGAGSIYSVSLFHTRSPTHLPLLTFSFFLFLTPSNPCSLSLTPARSVSLFLSHSHSLRGGSLERAGETTYSWSS